MKTAIWGGPLVLFLAMGIQPEPARAQMNTIGCGWDRVLPDTDLTERQLGAAVFLNDIFLFFTGTDHQFHYKFFNGANWIAPSGLASFTGPFNTELGLGVATNGTRLYAFAVRSEDQRVSVNTLTSLGWFGWTSVGSQMTDAAVGATTFNGLVHVFAKGHAPDQRIYFTSHPGDPAPWSDRVWTEVPGGQFTDTAVSAVSIGGNLYLFAKGVGSSQISVQKYNGSWSGVWTPVPGLTSDAAPSAAIWNGRVILLAKTVAPDSQIQFNSSPDGMTWDGWKPVTGNVPTDTTPVAVEYNGGLHLFDRLFGLEYIFHNVAYPNDAIEVVDVIPNDQSDETAHNPEPSIGVWAPGTSCEKVIVSALKLGGNNPYFLASDGGRTWGLFQDLFHYHTSVGWSPGGTAYAAWQGPHTMDVMSSDRATTPFVNIPSSHLSAAEPDPYGGLEPVGLLDHPRLELLNIGDQDRIYVGFKKVALFRAHSVRFSLDGGASWNTTFINAVVDSDPRSSTVSVAAAKDGQTVYAMFQQRNLRLAEGLTVRDDVFVVRDDNAGLDGFRSLDRGTRIDSTTVSEPSDPLRPSFLGPQLARLDCAIAVHPADPQKLYVAYVQILSGVPHLRVRYSSNGGESFGPIVFSPENPAALPALAVASSGTVGLLYTEQEGGFLVTHFVQALNENFAPVTTSDRILARFQIGSPVPVPDFGSYIGDFQDLKAIGNVFYGTFSAANEPDPAHFPSGVRFNRNVRDAQGVIRRNAPLTTSGTLMNLTEDNSVAASIDPFYFRANAIGLFFAASAPYLVRSVGGAHGTLQPSGPTFAGAGGSVTNSAKPETNYAVNVWYLDGRIVQTNGNTYTVTNIQGDHTVTATFAALNDLALAQYAVSDKGGDKPYRPFIGDEITYAISVANVGINPATGVTVVDTLPSSTTFVSAQSSQGSCGAQGGTVICSVGSTARGSSATIWITVIPGAAGLVTNTASVYADEQDADSSNNQASFAIPVRSPVLIPVTSVWRYLDNGSDLGTAWQKPGFDDSTWATGVAEFGFGDGDEQTQLQGGHTTYYFRRTFEVEDPEDFGNLAVRLRRDDGAVVHLNGTEVFRSNMPTGMIRYVTFASVPAADVDETNVFISPVITRSLLREGPNAIAVEVHQASANDGDLSFDLELVGNLPPPASQDISVPAGWSTFANNFNIGSNTLSEVLPQVADGTEIYKWNFATQSYSNSLFQANLGWSPNFSLRPGEGAWIHSGIPQSIKLTPPPDSPDAVARPPTAGLRFVSCRWPVSSTFDEVMGFPAVEGDRMLFYEGLFAAIPSQPTRVFSFSNGVWNPTLPPLVEPGKAVFVDLVAVSPSCPFIVCPSDIWTNTDLGLCGRVVTYTVAAGNSCNTNDLILTCIPPSGSFFPAGITTVFCTNRAPVGGKFASCHFNVTIEDNEDPVINCPTNMIVSCAGPVSFSASATDNCSPSPDIFILCSPTSGSFFAVGTTTVFCSAFDQSGNASVCHFTVTVSSNCPPTTSCDCRATNLIANGSFEQPGVPDGYVALPGGDATIQGWATLLNGVQYYNPVVAPSFVNTGFAADGSYLIDLAPAQGLGGGIQQTFTTVPGRTYYVCFAMGTSKERGRSGTASLTATVAGNAHAFDMRTDNPNIVWERKKFSFTATSTATTLVFSSLDDPALSYVNLDDVCVSVGCVEVSCPTDIVAYACRSNSVPVTYSALATNYCNPTDLSVAFDPPSGSSFPIGVTPVTVTATGSEQANQCRFTVTVLSNCPPASCSPNLLVNGSFELPGLPDEYAYIDGGSAFITGWTTLLHGVEYADLRSMRPEVMQAGVAADGIYTLDLAALHFAGGGIEQKFSTLPNHQYHVSFKLGTYGLHGRDGTGSLTAEADWGPSVPKYAEAFSTANYGSTVEWSLKRLTFTTPAAGTETTLRFVSDNDGDTNFVVLDDVRVTDCCIELICPSKVTAECQTPNGAPVAWTVFATNHCGTNLTVTCTPSPGSWFPPGTNLVTCTARGDGVSQTCTFPVIVAGSCGGLCEENLLVNGSFEQPGRDDGYLAVPAGSPSVLLPGWTVLPAGVEYQDGTSLHPAVREPGRAPDGSFAIDLAYVTSPDGGGVEQFVTTIPGETYTLSFYAGTLERDGRDGTGRLEVSVGSIFRTYALVNHNNHTQWDRYTFPFMADSVSTLVKFTTADNALLHFVGIDDVRLSRCPTNGPPGPGLTLTALGNCLLRLCWSDLGTNYLLQYTTNLASPVQWQDVAAPVTAINGERCVILSNACQATKFFRLMRMSLPVFTVTGPAVTPLQFSKLAQRLSLPPGAYDTNGFVRFTDVEKFQAVPTEVLGDPNKRDEENVPLMETRLMFDQINQMQVLSGQAALQLTVEALNEAGLLSSPTGPFRVIPEVLHSRFKAVSANGAPVSDVAIDTKVRHQFALGGLPMVGPGAKAAIHFGTTGVVTHINYSLRPVQAGPDIPIVPSSIADQVAANSYQAWLKQTPGKLSLSSTLVYYAPPPELGGVQTLLPHYQYEATFMPTGATSPFLLRSVLIPAVASSNFVPTARVTVSVQNGLVSAQAFVSGGRVPYTYQWNSSSAVLDGTNSPTLSYVASPRDQETLSLLVVDANGISVNVSSNFFVNGVPLTPMDSDAGYAPAGAAAGEIDVGAEWIGLTADPRLDGTSANAAGFVSRMRADASVSVRFNWGERNAWERDFKDTSLGGDDQSRIDNVDAAFYTGHANGDGWVFTSAHDDDFMDYTQARFGEVDLEWLTIAACGPLQEGAPPTAWWQRWGPAFRGLHLLCGYDNNSRDVSDEGRKWADYMLRGRPVAQAWMLTGMEAQWDAGLHVCVMAVNDARGVCNINDHFWGKGSVGPDIRVATGFVLYESPVD